MKLPSRSLTGCMTIFALGFCSSPCSERVFLLPLFASLALKAPLQEIEARHCWAAAVLGSPEVVNACQEV